MNRSGLGNRLLFAATMRVCGRAAVTATLCALLAGQPIVAEAPMPASVATVPMASDVRVLHALNRLTFGPRPGDAAAVQQMGLEKWFELQLDPGRIDDSRLNGMLEQFPAAMLPTETLERRFPSPLMVKAMEDGRVPMPADPTARAIAQDQIEFYNTYKAKQAKADAQPGTPAAAMNGGPEMAQAPTDAAGQSAESAKDARKRKRQAMVAGQAAMDGTGAGTEADKPVAAAEMTDPMSRLPAVGKGVFPAAKVEQILSLPPTDRYNAVLALAPKDVVLFETTLGRANAPRLTEGMTPAQKETIIALNGSIQLVALEASETRLMRDVYSDRQMEAVMTDFWLNHFNVYARKNQYEPYMLAAYERDTIRPNALGNFEQLLVATAKSPAMLEYLDNFKSVGPDSQMATRVTRAKAAYPNAKVLKAANSGLNENYGRELMELHTLGVNGAGYTQADVTNMAKIFTGWTLEKPLAGGGFVFDERKHEPGSKTLLGKTYNEAGEKEGLEVLHMLATSPATAQFISKKLAVRFVSDTPPQALVDRMADSFLKSNGDIKTVLRTMFKSPEFWSEDVYRAKLKTPEEFVISALRASSAEVQNPAPLVQSLGILGMPLYGMQTPNGYSWTRDGWLNTGALVARMNFSLVMSSNWMRGTETEWDTLLGGARPGVKPAAYTAEAGGDAAKERRLELILLGQPVSDKTRATVLAQANDQTITEQAATSFDLGAGGKKAAGRLKPRSQGLAGRDANAPSDDPQAAVMAGLLLGSPEFQRR